MANLVYKAGICLSATDLYNQLRSILSNTFSSTEPRGFGWTLLYNTSTEAVLSSTGSSGYERIFIRLKIGADDTYLDKGICQVANSTNTLVNPVGYSTAARINLGTLNGPIGYYLLGNKDFIQLTIKTTSGVINHNYLGSLNRFGTSDNGSLYGAINPSPINTTTPTSNFTIGTNTLVYLRIGQDGYGGVNGNSSIFTAGARLMIVDQSIGGTTSGNIGIVSVISSTASSVNLTYISGATTFSSFSVIGVDPVPTLINVNSSIKLANFLAIYDGSGTLSPSYSTINETNTGVITGLQNPNKFGVFIGYPFRIQNTSEVRGTLFGVIDVPNSTSATEDIYITYDNAHKFINFVDGSNFIAIGSVI